MPIDRSAGGSSMVVKANEKLAAIWPGGSAESPSVTWLARTVTWQLVPPGRSVLGSSVKLVAGELPTSASKAIVRSDSNCQPDEQGVSHCLNELEIGAAKVVVRHHHKMSEVPCLTPGETVFVISAEHYKVL